MVATEIPGQFGLFLRHLRISLFYGDLQGISGSGAQTVALNGVGGSTMGFGQTPGTVVIPQGGKVIGVQQHLVTSFAGGSLSALTASIGKLGASNTFLTYPFDIFQAGGDTVVQETSLFISGQRSTWTVTATLTPTGDKVSAATSGQLDIYIVYLSASDPTA